MVYVAFHSTNKIFWQIFYSFLSPEIEIHTTMLGCTPVYLCILCILCVHQNSVGCFHTAVDRLLLQPVVCFPLFSHHWYSVLQNASGYTQSKRVGFRILCVSTSLGTFSAAMATKSRNSVELTLDKKLSLIKAAECGKSHRKLAEEFGIGKTQFGTILKRKREITEAYERNQPASKRRCTYTSSNDDLNSLM